MHFPYKTHNHFLHLQGHKNRPKVRISNVCPVCQTVAEKGGSAAYVQRGWMVEEVACLPQNIWQSLDFPAQSILSLELSQRFPVACGHKTADVTAPATGDRDQQQAPHHRVSPWLAGGGPSSACSGRLQP